MSPKTLFSQIINYLSFISNLSIKMFRKFNLLTVDHLSHLRIIIPKPLNAVREIIWVTFQEWFHPLDAPDSKSVYVGKSV